MCLTELPKHLIEKIVQDLSSDDFIRLTLAYQRTILHPYLLHYIEPLYFPERRTKYPTTLSIQQPFVWGTEVQLLEHFDQSGSSVELNLTSRQIQFLNHLLRPPYNCIIAGGFPSRGVLRSFASNNQDNIKKPHDGDVDVYIPINTTMNSVLKLAKGIFCQQVDGDTDQNQPRSAGQKPMILQSSQFCEIWFGPSIKNIQLIHKDDVRLNKRRRDNKKFAAKVLDEFDLTYCCAAIFYDKTIDDLIWACSQSFLYAQQTQTTYFLKQGKPTKRRIQKAERLGFRILFSQHTSSRTKLCTWPRSWYGTIEPCDDRFIHEIKTDYYNHLFESQQEDEDLQMFYLETTSNRLPYNMSGVDEDYTSKQEDIVVNNTTVDGLYYDRWGSQLLTSHGSYRIRHHWAFFKEKSKNQGKSPLAAKIKLHADSWQQLVGCKAYFRDRNGIRILILVK